MCRGRLRAEGPRNTQHLRAFRATGSGRGGHRDGPSGQSEAGQQPPVPAPSSRRRGGRPGSTLRTPAREAGTGPRGGGRSAPTNQPHEKPEVPGESRSCSPEKASRSGPVLRRLPPELALRRQRVPECGAPAGGQGGGQGGAPLGGQSWSHDDLVRVVRVHVFPGRGRGRGRGQGRGWKEPGRGHPPPPAGNAGFLPERLDRPGPASHRLATPASRLSSEHWPFRHANAVRGRPCRHRDRHRRLSVGLPSALAQVRRAVAANAAPGPPASS